MKALIMKLSEGNPGAIGAMCRMVNELPSEVAELSLQLLDKWEIYGTEIYILMNDKCENDVHLFILLLAAVEREVLPLQRLKELAEDQRREVNLTEEEWRLIRG